MNENGSHTHDEGEHPESIKHMSRVLQRLAIAIIDEHEHMDHNDDICWPERIGLVAWVAHTMRMPINNEAFAMLADYMAEYEEHHQELADVD